MNKVFKFIWFFNPLRELFKVIRELYKQTNPSLVSKKGYEIMSNPEAMEEFLMQIQRWKDAGGSGICVVNVDAKFYQKVIILEKINK